MHCFIFSIYSEDHTTIYRNRSADYPVSEYITVYPHGRPSYYVNMDNPMRTDVARDVWRQLMVEGGTLGEVKWKETTR